MSSDAVTNSFSQLPNDFILDSFSNYFVINDFRSVSLTDKKTNEIIAKYLSELKPFFSGFIELQNYYCLTLAKDNGLNCNEKYFSGIHTYVIINKKDNVYGIFYCAVMTQEKIALAMLAPLIEKSDFVCKPEFGEVTCNEKNEEEETYTAPIKKINIEYRKLSENNPDAKLPIERALGFANREFAIKNAPKTSL